MQVFESLEEMQGTAIGIRSERKLIALVSTSGFLNPGHRGLIEAAKELSDVVVVSTFVNPVEFGANEDFSRYPTDPDRDEAFCREYGVDILFRPSKEEVYPQGYASYVTEERIGQILCGISRPAYFRGVCTWHAQLFNLTRPDFLVTGRRDAQKGVVLKKLIEELRYPIQCSEVPVVRNEDGIAENGRLSYLNSYQLKDAAVLYPALKEGQSLIDQGIRNVDRILGEVTHHISQSRRLRVIYVSAVDPQTMLPRREIILGDTLIMAAVWCDEVRLIDNLLV